MNRNRHNLFSLILTFMTVLTIICLSVSLVLWLFPMYNLAVSLFDLPGKTGLSKETIIENYRVLVRYNMLWGPGTLELPDFSSSPSGLVHFADVKRLLRNVQLMGVFGAIFTLIGWFMAKKKRAFAWMKWSIIVILSMGAGLTAGLLFSAEGTFVFLHKILFTNTYWKFYPEKDPVITILPGEVFLAAGIEAAVFAGIGLIVLWLNYRRQTAVSAKAKSNTKTNTNKSRDAGPKSTSGTGIKTGKKTSTETNTRTNTGSNTKTRTKRSI